MRLMKLVFNLMQRVDIKYENSSIAPDQVLKCRYGAMKYDACTEHCN